MNSKHAQFTYNNEKDLESFGLIETLNPEISQVISGGALPTIQELISNTNEIKIYNGTQQKVVFDLTTNGFESWMDYPLASGQTAKFEVSTVEADVIFDKDYCMGGIQPEFVTVDAPGSYPFYRNGCILGLA